VHVRAVGFKPVRSDAELRRTPADIAERGANTFLHHVAELASEDQGGLLGGSAGDPRRLNLNDVTTRFGDRQTVGNARLVMALSASAIEPDRAKERC
jgi:hypothetical protein